MTAGAEHKRWMLRQILYQCSKWRKGKPCCRLKVFTVVLHYGTVMQ
jgi:hypothetical protein